MASVLPVVEQTNGNAALRPGIDEPRFRVCLERTVELGPVQLGLLDWPGLNGPLVHVPDAGTPSRQLAGALAETFGPTWRVVSLRPRGNAAYQVDASDLLATLDQFGFRQPTLVAEGVGCLSALLVAAWHPDRVARLVMVGARFDSPPEKTTAAIALRTCPPDVAGLRRLVRATVADLETGAAAIAHLSAVLDEPRATPPS